MKDETPTEQRPPLPDDQRRQLEQELLVTRCQLGDREALDELVARWHPALWRYVRSLTDDAAAAEEVMQEGWLRILRAIGRLRDPARLPAWLFTIVRRTFTDRLRSRYKEAGVEALDEQLIDGQLIDGEPVDTGSLDGGPPRALAFEERALLRAALHELQPADRETVVLYYFQELDLREVAEVLAIPAGTVKSRLHRARRQLRDRLSEKGLSR